MLFNSCEFQEQVDILALLVQCDLDVIFSEKTKPELAGDFMLAQLQGLQVLQLYCLAIDGETGVIITSENCQHLL